MKLFSFGLAKAFGGLIGVLCLALAIGLAANPDIFGSSSIEWAKVILFGTLGLLGLCVFILSNRRIKKLEETDKSAAKKYKQDIGWKVKLILIIIFLLWLVLIALFS